MIKYEEAEQRLFELLRDRGGKMYYRPQYCLDWSACGPLMVEHGLKVDCSDADDDWIVYVWFAPRGYLAEHLSHHPNKDTAVRYAIVMAVIKKLESAP